MLPDEPALFRCRSLRLPPWLLAGWIAVASSSCSSLPKAEHPQHKDHSFRASYVIGEDGRLMFPSTSRDLIIKDLQLTPEPSAEKFHNDQRWFVYPPGKIVHAHGSLRAYANESGIIPELDQLLPSAKLLPSLTPQQKL